MIKLLAAAALVAAAPAAGQSIPIELAPGEALLKIEAEGEALSTPDVMTVEAGVVTTGQTAREAMSANSALANRLIDVVRTAGVAAVDVRTSELSVNPRFEESDRVSLDEVPPRIIGYVAHNRVELRLRDIEAAPQIIDGLFAAGANEVRGPVFSLSNPEAAEAEARRMAIVEAREEAAAYADALGMRITRVLRVSQRGDFDMEGGNHIVVSGSRVRPTPVEPGQVETKATVWIDYAMTPK